MTLILNVQRRTLQIVQRSKLLILKLISNRLKALIMVYTKLINSLLVLMLLTNFLLMKIIKNSWTIVVLTVVLLFLAKLIWMDLLRLECIILTVKLLLCILLMPTTLMMQMQQNLLLILRKLCSCRQKVSTNAIMQVLLL